MFDIQKISIDQEDKLKQFISSVTGVSLFHELDFLAYHGDKFRENEEHLIWLKGNEIVASLSIAIFVEDGLKIAKSPYGASYGGVLTREEFGYEKSKAIIESLIQYAIDNEWQEVRITPLPLFMSGKKSETFNFTLLEKGFNIMNNDILSVIPLKERNDLKSDSFTSSCRRFVKKAIKSEVKVVFNDSINPFWKVLEKTFEKHNTSPTHTKEEWKYLMKKYPEKVWVDVAYINEIPVASVGHFVIVEKRVDSSFYICQDPEYQDTQALTYLITEILNQSKSLGYDYFDFGTSSVNQIARPNIFRFKESFGAIGQFRTSYKFDLARI